MKDQGTELVSYNSSESDNWDKGRLPLNWSAVFLKTPIKVSTYFSISVNAVFKRLAPLRRFRNEPFLRHHRRYRFGDKAVSSADNGARRLVALLPAHCWKEGPSVFLNRNHHNRNVAAFKNPFSHTSEIKMPLIAPVGQNDQINLFRLNEFQDFIGWFADTDVTNVERTGI